MDRRTDVGQLATKRGLLRVSRLLEEWLADEDAWQGDRPLLLTTFQDHAYFAGSAARYAALAEHLTVVVAFAGDGPVPAGLAQVRLDPDEPLAREWSVLVLGDEVAGVLSAVDQHTSVPAASLELGRVFQHDVSCDPRVVAQHARRLVELLGARLPGDLADAVEDAAARAEAQPPDRARRVLARTIEAAAEEVTHLVLDLALSDPQAHRDPTTGAHDRRALSRYLRGAGRCAPAVSLLAFEVEGLGDLTDAHGEALRGTALRAVATIVRARMRPPDVLVRTGDDAFLVLAPAMGRLAAAERAAAIVSDVADWVPPPPAQHRRLGMCAGVGRFRADAIDLSAIDDALYRATLAGSGRVEVLPTLVPSG
ncbi:MAG: DICT sensory domain-containing protein [Actinomycetes bacterium]